MKRRITLSIAVALIVTLVSLTSSDSMVKAQQNRFRVDTGVVALGAEQELRVTVVGHLDLNDLYIRVNRQFFTQDVCNGGVCRLVVASQTTSDPIILTPGEALSVAVDPSDPNVIYVRAVVMSNSRNVRVNAEIVDDAGHVVALLATSEVDTWLRTGR
jgi:hypothetical protein